LLLKSFCFLLTRIIQLWAPKCVCGQVIFVKLGAHTAPILFTVICNPAKGIKIGGIVHLFLLLRFFNYCDTHCIIRSVSWYVSNSESSVLLHPYVHLFNIVLQKYRSNVCCINAFTFRFCKPWLMKWYSVYGKNDYGPM
jgi:hypothetical protein